MARYVVWREVREAYVCKGAVGAMGAAGAMGRRGVAHSCNRTVYLCIILTGGLLLVRRAFFVKCDGVKFVTAAHVCFGVLCV
jgi:hypothetical protein